MSPAPDDEKTKVLSHVHQVLTASSAACHPNRQLRQHRCARAMCHPGQRSLPGMRRFSLKASCRSHSMLASCWHQHNCHSWHQEVFNPQFSGNLLRTSRSGMPSRSCSRGLCKSRCLPSLHGSRTSCDSPGSVESCSSASHRDFFAPAPCYTRP